MNARRRASGFTLLELLVVVAVLAILGSLLLPVLARAIIQTREGVTQSLLASTRAALAVYKSDEGVFPGHAGADGADETLALYRALRNAPGAATGGGHRGPYLSPPSEHYGLLRVGFDDSVPPPQGQPLQYNAEGVDLALRQRVDDPTFQQSALGRRLVLVDAWGNAIHYREWEHKGPASKGLALDKDLYDLWSNGPDGTNAGGHRDDVR